MAKLQFSSIGLLLLKAVAALAAPNGSPTSAQPALRVFGASTFATATAMPASSILSQSEPHQFQADLKRRSISLVSLPGTLSSASLSIANSFTNDGNSSGANPSSVATSSSPDVMATGKFTAADGGVYGVTSQSGYVVVDGKTLYSGQRALIGNEEVTEGPSGLVANGAKVALSTTTISPAVTTSSAEATTTSSAVSSVATSTASGSVIAAGSTLATVAAAASSSSSAAAAAPTYQAGHALAAAAGGLVGLMLL
ncbi:hypothetical protein LTR36_002224 [Oleoguttula mirabilis]|uniref:Uncharacterized protein n=1 Tax=Oleoguttula mirabilis TaxID=1507867 RepID=A0AAV9JKQ9_9PEZI|nr:hypothetical protein LTR36_002224 [Oleoguttula mirabilis]